MSLKPITRDAMGRPLRLGGLYNACTDETLPGAMFKVKNVEQSQNTEVDIQYYFEDDDSEKFRKLDIEAELSVSLKCGLVKFSGHGSYFSNEESKQRTVKATLSYRWKTIYESFNHLDPNSADLFQGVEAEYFGTHFVQGIQYGGAIYLTLESKVCDHTEVEQIKAEMDASIELLIAKIRGSADEEFSQKVKNLFSSFKIDMKGTLKDNCLSTNPSDIIQFISQIPKQQETINDGKGFPLKYTLYPLAAYEKCQNMKIERLLGTVDDIVLGKTANNLTEFERLKKEVKILQALGASTREFTPPTIFQEFDEVFNKLNTLQNTFIKAIQDGLLKWRAENNSDPLIKALEDLENSGDLVSLKTTIINLRDLHELIFLTLNIVQKKYNIKLLPYNKQIQDFSVQNEKNLVFVYYCSTIKSIIDESFVYFLEKQKTLQTQYADSTFLLVNIETNLYHKELRNGIEQWENHKLQNLIRRHVWPDKTSYDGEWKDDKRNGKGKYVWKDGSFYEGDWKDDKKDGKGKCVSPDGAFYEGDWKDDKKAGKGKKVYSDGSTYDGDWKDDKRNGEGKRVFSTGSTYDGDWKDDKKHGQGKYVWPDGTSYDGEWKDDKKDGKGKFVSPDGAFYDGDWKNGKKDGQGKYVWPSGAVYEGYWKDGKQNGKGKYVWPDETSYDGDWKDDKKNGKGKRVYSNGSTYDGEWKDDNRNGNGKNVWPDGASYDGDWKNDNMTGKGKYVWPDGASYDGEWKDDNMNGKGKRVSSDGSTYDGYWKDDKKNGKGKYVWPDGAFYDGDWKDDKENGKGKFVWPDGTFYEGYWKDGNMNGKGKRGKKTGKTHDGDCKDGKRNGTGKPVWPEGTFTDRDWNDGNMNGKGKRVSSNASTYDGDRKDGKRNGFWSRMWN